MKDSIDNSQDLLDSRDIQKRIDELQGFAEPDEWERQELNNLLSVKEQYGSDEDWAFGVTFIRESYFQDDSEEFAYDCMGIDRNGGMTQYIDWERFAEDRKANMSSLKFDGVTYWIN